MTHIFTWPLAAVALGCLFFCAGCGGAADSNVVPSAPDETSPFAVPAVRDTSSTEEPNMPARCGSFSEVAKAVGIDHVYINGQQGKSLMVEAIGGGCGWLDYDADGHWDLYLNQGGDPTKDADSAQPNDALFRNLGNGTFASVTEHARIEEFGYGQGVAVGDYDNDGFDDIYVTNVGENTLWHNLGDGTFEEVGQPAGVTDPRWSSSAAWSDLDLDGDLDLYVCNYTIYDPKHPLDCRNKAGEPRICHPKDVKPWPDEFYLNRGDGTFDPQSRQRGLFGDGNKALGVAVADFNNDGLPDIYVANDTTGNFLFVNQGDATFKELGLLQGCAVDRAGSFQASMGVGIGDYDRNDFLDIYVTHFYDESNTLYRNEGPAGFQDVTSQLGLHGPAMPRLGFGTMMADFDHDGWLEMFVANGHIENYVGNPLHHMKPQLFSYNGKHWVDCSTKAGDFFGGKYVGRGVAGCDFDEDGDIDLAVVHQNDAAAILRNDSERGHWLKFQFRGHRNNRRGIGCRVTVTCGELTLVQELCGGTSYDATHQPSLNFGLGELDHSCTVVVRWPDGTFQTIKDVAVDQELVLDEPESE